MGMEDEVIADPDRVEPESLGRSNAFDEEVLVGVLAEVRDEESEARHRYLVS
jgi:hypothetical protein